jgi:hypothetical protein
MRRGAQGASLRVSSPSLISRNRGHPRKSLLHVGGGPFRTDTSTKLLRINTEREIVGGQAAIRQPDSDIFRSWEIAGASHVDYWYMTYRQALVARDGLRSSFFNSSS